MVSGADVRVALEAGLWAALVGSDDRAAMRSSCRDARAMADMLHDTAVLPVGPETLHCASSIAACHRRLGTVQALHVRYSAEDGDEARVVWFMEAYSAALGTALPATHCIIDVAASRRLPPPFAAVLLQRVVPGVERLDMALGSYGNLAQLLQALEPCTRLRALRLLPRPLQHGNQTAQGGPRFNLTQETCVLDALCRLAHLHTLSGPWRMTGAELKRLCDALPGLTTLGFKLLNLRSNPPCACISRQLHTLTACSDAAGPGAVCTSDTSAIATALPSVQQLKGINLRSNFSSQAEVLAVRETVQRFAVCAHEWTLHGWPGHSVQPLAQCLPAGCLAPLQHLALGTGLSVPSAVVVEAILGCMVSAAPNLATVQLHWCTARVGWDWPAMAMVRPLRQAAHLHTLRLAAIGDSSPERQAAVLEGAVRCLTQPGAEGEGAPCRALQRVLLYRAPLDALQGCRRALEADGITVRVDTYY